MVCFFSSRANNADSLRNNVREKILDEIRQNFDTKNKILDSTIIRLDDKVSRLDSIINNSGSSKERTDRLIERVQLLEAKQKALEENELNVYEANYQSAVINLVSMDREIKPLLLFNATRDFFNTLTETGNPMNYDGFQNGYTRFRIYVDRYKDHDVALKSISDVVSATGSISFGVPLVGVYSQLLFTGMSKYINSIGHRKRQLKTDAEKMFAIATAVSQFTTDKNIVEHEWDDITQALCEMQVRYDTVLNCNLRMINISRNDLSAQFTQEHDANRRYTYLTYLRQQAMDYVITMKKNNPKDWKENIFYQLMDVQSLKLKYGDLTYRIRQHIGKYDRLFAKYKADKNIGSHVSKLDEKLNQLKATFDATFEPTQYAHAATQMYRVM